MLYIYLLIWLSLSERFLNISVGSFQFGLGDILLLLAPLVLVFQNYKMSRWSFVAVILTFFLLTQVTIYNDFIGVNATITIPLKLVIAGLLYQELKKLRAVTLWRKVNFFSLILLIIMICFFSGRGFLQQELFNRNELISYLLAFFAFHVCLIQKCRISDKKIILIHILLFIIFSMTVILGESRQGILVLIIIFLCYLIQNLKWKNILKITILSCMIIVPTTISITAKFSDEYNQNRLKTIQSFEPQTQADNFRLLNALYVLNNFQSAIFFGHGNNSFVKDGPFKKVVHNAYLSTIYEFGIVGLSFLIFCMYLIIRPFAISLRKRNQLPLRLKLPATFLVGISVQALFIEVLAKPPIFIILGCAMYLFHCQLKFLKNRL